jgi:hypothetical protein
MGQDIIRSNVEYQDMVDRYNERGNWLDGEFDIKKGIQTLKNYINEYADSGELKIELDKLAQRARGAEIYLDSFDIISDKEKEKIMKRWRELTSARTIAGFLESKLMDHVNDIQPSRHMDGKEFKPSLG